MSLTQDTIYFIKWHSLSGTAGSKHGVDCGRLHYWSVIRNSLKIDGPHTALKVKHGSWSDQECVTSFL